MPSDRYWIGLCILAFIMFFVSKSIYVLLSPYMGNGAIATGWLVASAVGWLYSQVARDA